MRLQLCSIVVDVRECNDVWLLSDVEAYVSDVRAIDLGCLEHDATRLLRFFLGHCASTGPRGSKLACIHHKGAVIRARSLRLARSHCDLACSTSFRSMCRNLHLLLSGEKLAQIGATWAYAHPLRRV